MLEAMKFFLPSWNHPMLLPPMHCLRNPFQKRYLGCRLTLATITYIYHMSIPLLLRTQVETTFRQEKVMSKSLAFPQQPGWGCHERWKCLVFSLCSHRVSVLWKGRRNQRKANFRAIKRILSNLVSSSQLTSFPWEYVQMAMWNKLVNSKDVCISLVCTEILFLT